MKLKLFHQIGPGGAESAPVRQFIVDNGLEDLVEFLNINYPEHESALREYTGGTLETPVLFTGERAVRGREQILDWLRTNVLAQRE